MRALPPAGVRIDPALIERLQDCLQRIERLQQLIPQVPLPYEAREILKFCAASDAVPKEMGALACRLLFAAPSPALEAVATQNAEGQTVITYFMNSSPPPGEGTWFYAVKHADEEGNVQELRSFLLCSQFEMTDYGRALLNDFVERYALEARYGLKASRRWDMKARQALARALEGGLKRPRARPATPIYTRSDADARIECALAELRALRKVFGRSAGDKEKVAALHGLSESTLEGALGVRRGSSRRKAARRKKAMPRR
jgi:hypothetical protein